MSSETCFCGCTLGRGALAIGTINAIAGILAVGRDSIVVTAAIFYPDQFVDPAFHENPSRYYTICGVRICISVVHTILSCFMVHGCRTKNNRLIMPWVIWTYVCIIVEVSLAVIMFFLFVIFVLFSGQIGVGFWIFLTCLVILGVQAYFLSVVRTFSHVLKRDTVQD